MSFVFRDDASNDSNEPTPQRGSVGVDSDDAEYGASSFEQTAAPDKENTSPICHDSLMQDSSYSLITKGMQAHSSPYGRNTFMDVEAAEGSYLMEAAKPSTSSSTGRPLRMIFSPHRDTKATPPASPFLQASDHGSLADFNLGSPLHPRPTHDDCVSYAADTAADFRESINFFDPIQSNGKVTFDEITAFMANRCGATVTSVSSVTYTVLDYLMVLHMVEPSLLDLASVCWSTNPIPSQLEHNARIFLDAAQSLAAKHNLPSITNSYLIQFGNGVESGDVHTQQSSRLVIPTMNPDEAHNDLFLSYQREAAGEGSAAANFLTSPTHQDSTNRGTQLEVTSVPAPQVATGGNGVSAIVVSALIDGATNRGGVHLALQGWLYRAHKTIESAEKKQGETSLETPSKHRIVKVSAMSVRSAAMRQYCHTLAPLKALYELGLNDAAQNFVMSAQDRLKEQHAAAAADALKQQAKRAESAVSKSRFAMVPSCASRALRSTTPPPPAGAKRGRDDPTQAGSFPASRKPPIPEAARGSNNSATDSPALYPHPPPFELAVAPFPNLSVDLARPQYTLETQVSDFCMTQVVLEALQEQLYQANLKFYELLGSRERSDALWAELVGIVTKDASEFAPPRARL